MKSLLFKTLVFTHRYFGIAIGWLMLMWCLSGLVMLYVSYPELRNADRQALLSTLNLSDCCTLPQNLLPADTAIASVQIEMLADQPLLRIQPADAAAITINLHTGAVLESVTTAMALAAAQQHLSFGVAAPTLLGLIERDQWTVYPRYRAYRPLYHFALNDAVGTEVYVASTTGEVVQKTIRIQRFWNWLGAVPHWLYFTILRDNSELWSQVVIWCSLVGTFLTVFGLYLGVWQLRRKSDNALHSPYRGWKYWHHVPGLLFGALVLTWVLSGLLSMTPWGLLESSGKDQEQQLLRGELPTWQAVRDSVQRIASVTLPADTVHIESNLLQGELYYLIDTRQGARTRHDNHWQTASLSELDWQRLARRLVPAGHAELLHREDAYWYSHVHTPVTLPVIRVLSDEGTRYYVDSVSGELLSKVDQGARWYRWLHSGLHRLDFSTAWRVRPFRDIWIWLLLLGSSLVCATGVWLGVRHLRRSNRVMR
jgi:uncharacterized iron-regulated membrane protein